VGKKGGRMGGEEMAAGGCRVYQLDENMMCTAVLVPTPLIQSCAVMDSRPGGAGGDGSPLKTHTEQRDREPRVTKHLS